MRTVNLWNLDGVLFSMLHCAVLSGCHYRAANDPRRPRWSFNEDVVIPWHGIDRIRGEKRTSNPQSPLLFPIMADGNNGAATPTRPIKKAHFHLFFFINGHEGEGAKNNWILLIILFWVEVSLQPLRKTAALINFSSWPDQKRNRSEKNGRWRAFFFTATGTRRRDWRNWNSRSGSPTTRRPNCCAAAAKSNWNWADWNARRPPARCLSWF